MTSTIPTDADIARLRALCAETSPGPWRCERDAAGSTVRTAGPDACIARLSYTGSMRDEENAEFICEARSVLPALLDEVARSRAFMASLAGAICPPLRNEGCPADVMWRNVQESHRMRIEQLQTALREACAYARHFADVAGHPDDEVAITALAAVDQLAKLAGGSP